LRGMDEQRWPFQKEHDVRRKNGMNPIFNPFY
jgi:hypothetical protein